MNSEAEGTVTYNRDAYMLPLHLHISNPGDLLIVRIDWYLVIDNLIYWSKIELSDFCPIDWFEDDGVLARY